MWYITVVEANAEQRCVQVAAKWWQRETNCEGIRTSASKSCKAWMMTFLLCVLDTSTRSYLVSNYLYKPNIKHSHTGAEVRHAALSCIFHRAKWDCRDPLLLCMTDGDSASLSGSPYRFSNYAVACTLAPPVQHMMITIECCTHLYSCAPSHIWRHWISVASAKFHTLCSKFQNFFQWLFAIVTKNNCIHHVSAVLNLMMKVST